jgi:hypothetical protein
VRRLKKTTEQFIKEAIAKHGDKYDYSLVEYIDSRTKVKIKCSKHEITEQFPNTHLRSIDGCQKCSTERTANSQRKTTEQFIKEAIAIHGDKYDYSLVDYKKASINVTIKCKRHGLFQQQPHNHVINKAECPQCAHEEKYKKMTKTTEEFIQEANIKHNNKYDYSLVDYKGAHEKVIIICEQHGKFKQSPNSHLSDAGCPKCFKTGVSKQQIEWLEYIEKKDNIKIQHAMNEGEFRIDKYRVDGYCKETNTVYEYNGNYFHGNPQFFKPLSINSVCKRTHGDLYIGTLEKQLYIEKKEYNYISIWEHEWEALKKTF